MKNRQHEKVGHKLNYLSQDVIIIYWKIQHFQDFPPVNRVVALQKMECKEFHLEVAVKN